MAENVQLSHQQNNTTIRKTRDWRQEAMKSPPPEPHLKKFTFIMKGKEMKNFLPTSIPIAGKSTH